LYDRRLGRWYRKQPGKKRANAEKYNRNGQKADKRIHGSSPYEAKWDVIANLEFGTRGEV
jgi:hypothetical protein